jgi:hypothetical protein
VYSPALISAIERRPLVLQQYGDFASSRYVTLWRRTDAHSDAVWQLMETPGIELGSVRLRATTVRVPK